MKLNSLKMDSKQNGDVRKSFNTCVTFDANGLIKGTRQKKKKHGQK